MRQQQPPNKKESNTSNLYGLGIEKQKSEVHGLNLGNIDDSIGVVGNGLKQNRLSSKAAANNNNRNQNNKRFSQSNANSATKQRAIVKNVDPNRATVRKFSTGDDMNEDETFKNKTLRFTNNNFIANKDQAKKENIYGL